MTKKYLSLLLIIAMLSSSLMSVSFAADGFGAIWTTDINQITTNENQYKSKEDVYLNGGPANKADFVVPNGNYYVKVEAPEGELLGEGTLGIGITTLRGIKLWDVIKKASDGSQGYDDTTNPDGVYKVTVSTSMSFEQNLSKSDNFKVVATPTVILPVTLQVIVSGPGVVIYGIDTTITTTGSYSGITSGTSVSLVPQANTGAHFVRWSGANGTEIANNTLLMNSNKEVTAVFENDVLTEEPTPTVTLQVIVSGPGVVIYGIDTTITLTTSYPGITSGTSVSLVPQANAGAHFVGWLGTNGTEIASDNTLLMNSNKEVTAVFEENALTEEPISKVTLEVIVSGPGVVNYGSDTITTTTSYPAINSGTSVSLVPQANAGAHFVGWSGANGTEILANTLIMNSNKEVTAVFELNAPVIPTTPTPTGSGVSNTYYTLTIAVEGPGSVLAQSGSHISNSMVIMTLGEILEGARFVGWFGTNGSEVSSNNAIHMTGNKSVIARFEMIPIVELEDEEVPQSGAPLEESNNDVILDETLPQGAPELPQTGGIPIELMVGAGLALTAGGLSLKKKEEKK